MSPMLPKDHAYFIDKLTTLGRTLRDAVLTARANNSAFAGVSKTTSADTIYQLDTHVEPVLEAFCENWSKEIPLVLIAEGIEDEHGREGKAVFPHGTSESAAAIRLIVDPIDGTRGLMYDKRAAWVLAGVAPNLGDATRLSHIQVAVQVEVPTSKQTFSDVLWAGSGGGAKGVRDDLRAHTSAPLLIKPSHADTLAHGFASIANFFPGTKELSSALMEKIAAQLLGPPDVGQAAIFDDQYICTGGQFYELIVGHDRFTADLRPLFYKIRNLGEGLCVHPYDVASALIAREAGVLITNGLGAELDGPLDVETSLSYAAFANPTLKKAIEPIIINFLHAHGI